MNRLGLGLTKKQIKEVTVAFDEDGEGEIDFDDFSYNMTHGGA